MKVFIKRNLVILFAVTMLLCGMLALLTSNRNTQVNAYTVASADFEVMEGASVRLKEPVGLRFKLKLSDTFKNSLKDTDQVGAFIFPKDYLPTSNTVDYAKDISTKLDYNLTDALYVDGGSWYANFVISNINKDNYNRDFVAIGYVKDADGNYTYTEYSAIKHARSVAYIAEKVYLNYSTPTDGYYDIRKTLADFMSPIREVNPVFAGFGTQENPYLIYTKSQFDSMGAHLSEFNYYEGKYFKLMQDLVDNATVVKKCGTQKAKFKGTFDGNGHTINVNITNSTSSETHIGLFAFNYGTIKNLTVTGTITTSNSNVGGIAGENSGIIYNCVNKATISGNNHVGGIAGKNYAYADSTIEVPVVENCTNEANITGTGYVAGIVGKNCSTVINSYNGKEVTITATSTKGDIVCNDGGTLENEIIPEEPDTPEEPDAVDFNTVLEYFFAQEFIKESTVCTREYLKTNAVSGVTITSKNNGRTEVKNMLVRACRKVTGNTQLTTGNFEKAMNKYPDFVFADETQKNYWYNCMPTATENVDGGMLRTFMIDIYLYLNK